MRAWMATRYGEPADVLSLVDDAKPCEPGPHQVKVRVEAAGLGLPDVFMCRSVYPLTPPLPFVPSQEAAGEIVAVGEGVDEAEIGRRVFGMTLFQAQHGGLAEECLMTADQVLDIPEGMSAEQAAGFWIPYWTGWFGLVVRGRMTATDTVLVLGASGSSGSAAVQIAKALGARVIAVAGGEEKSRFCRELGADAVIDRHKEDITTATRELTGGRGADVVYDPVGGEAASAALHATAFEGRFVLIGFASGEWPKFEPLPLIFQNISLLGSTPSLGSTTSSRPTTLPGSTPSPSFPRSFDFAREVIDDARETLIRHFQEGRLKTVGNEVFDFADGKKAIEHIAAGKVRGKVVVRVR